MVIQANAQHIRNDAMGATRRTTNRSNCSTPRHSTKSPRPGVGRGGRLNLEDTYRGGDEPGTHPLDLNHDIWLQNNDAKIIEIHNVDQTDEQARRRLAEKKENCQDSSLQPSKGDQASPPGLSECTGKFPTSSPRRAENHSPASDLALHKQNSSFNRAQSSLDGEPVVIKQAGKKLF